MKQVKKNVVQLRTGRIDPLRGGAAAPPAFLPVWGPLLGSYMIGSGMLVNFPHAPPGRKLGCRARLPCPHAFARWEKVWLAMASHG